MKIRGGIAILLTVLLFGFAWISIPAAASEKTSDEDISDAAQQVKELFEAVFENIDQEKASDAFEFLKEKIAQGDLTTEEGLSNAVEEVKEKFGVEISTEGAKELVETMEKLEGMGFSADYVLDKAEDLYKEYGAELVDNVDQAVTGAVKNAVSVAVTSFFENLAGSVKDFFTGLFS
ncbi:MAG: DUF1002 domain-containing protein [Lachnospiraceae bacterium]|nr:hypothetical protein C819_03580 [Lachnospiraceae bacterium 10-1]MCX4352491.1 DUF1002 domain-containing protein [Lachnospiraceae bacterium]